MTSTPLPSASLLVDELLRITELADGAVRRSAVDRADDRSGTKAALLGLLAWAVCQAHVVVAGLRSPAPDGVKPNVRVMLETLLTGLYLADPAADVEELERRLERYLRGVRAEQVKLRAALKGHGALLQFFEVDEDLAEREAEELRNVEAGLPQQDRLGRHWSGLPEGLKSVADAVGFAADYTVQYRAHSGSAHANRVWDMLEVDLDNPIVFPKSPIAGTGVPLAFDALRYIGLLLRAAHSCGAVHLYRSEQAALDGIKQYLQPMDVLFANGTLRSRRRDEDSTTPEATGGSV